MPHLPDPGPDRVEIDADGRFVVPAELVAAAFALAPADVPGLMRSGHLSSRLERGEGDDAGRFRLTFYHGAQALRLITDATGRIITRSRFPVSPRNA